MSNIYQRFCTISLCSAALSLSPSSYSASSSSISVCPDSNQSGHCDYSGSKGLQRAIDNANDGDSILLRTGIHTPEGSKLLAFDDIEVKSAITIAGKNLTLTGEDNTVIQGRREQPASAIGVKNARVAFNNLTIQGFVVAEKEDDIYDGHGIFVIDGEATLDNIEIIGLPKMAVSIRGESRIKADKLSVRNGHIGVWIEENAQLTLSNSYFSGNDSAGVAAYQQSQVSVDSSVFESNLDDGIYSSGESSIAVSNSTFINNSPYALRADESSNIKVDTSFLRDNDEDYSQTTDTASVTVGDNMLKVDPRSASNTLTPQSIIQDCPDCPTVVSIPTGEILKGVEPGEDLEQPDQQPRHSVAIKQSFALGIHPVTRKQFAEFIAATDYQTAPACNALDGVNWVLDSNRDWMNPGYPQQEDHPVVCVSWLDAKAYTKWLSIRTGQHYRLPSETEWEYSARSGMPEQDAVNLVNRSRANHGIKECCGPLKLGADKWDYTSPVGSLEVNAFGLYDTQGNVWEWVEDCYHDSYEGAPSDGSARTDQCSAPDRRVVRGGSWGDDSYYMHPYYRLLAPKDFGYFTLGFRVARELDSSEN